MLLKTIAIVLGIGTTFGGLIVAGTLWVNTQTTKLDAIVVNMNNIVLDINKRENNEYEIL